MDVTGSSDFNNKCVLIWLSLNSFPNKETVRIQVSLLFVCPSVCPSVCLSVRPSVPLADPEGGGRDVRPPPLKKKGEGIDIKGKKETRERRGSIFAS